MYAHIIFLHDYDDPEVDRLLKSEYYASNLIELARYLSQWDCGEYHDISSESPAGNDDDTHVFKIENAGTYELSINRGLGYAGLSVILEDED